MHRSLLVATLALTGCLSAATPTASARPAPAAPMKLDLSCFGGAEDDMAFGGAMKKRNHSRPALGWGSGRAAGGPAPAPPLSKSAPAFALDAEEAEAPMPSVPLPAEAPLQEVVGPVEPRPIGQPSFDWGGSTWLSNDDSMSLASAQRVLWALDRGRPVSTDQIRPHELLNYFSFDTEQPRGAESFEVTASAETHGDTLSVAFAVQGATPERAPLDLTMVLDRSCSMSDAGRMEYTKRGLHRMKSQLHDGDRLDVVLFDDRVCTPLENFVVGRDDPSVLESVIDRMQPEGGTDLDLGLREAYRVADRKTGTHRRNRRVMVLTDAMLNTGDVNHDTVSEIGKKYASEGIRLTGVGVGWDFNDDVLDKLTEKGKGAYVFLGSEAVVDRVFGSGFDALVDTLAHDVRFELDLPDSLALERFYGEEASTDKADIQPIHYYAGTSQVFLQDLAIDRSKLRDSDRVDLAIEWRDARTGEPERRVFHTTVGAMLGADPHNVRKARALMAFSDVLLERSMGGNACGDALSTYVTRAGGVEGDAELGYVTGLLEGVCPNLPSVEPVFAAAEPVGLKVKVDSDIPIAEVAAACGNGVKRDTIGPADTVARFDVAPGTCTLTLQGAVPMSTRIEVAQTGSDVRCLIRGGRLQCS